MGSEMCIRDSGSAVPDPRVARRAVNFASDVGLDDKQVSVGHIQQIMHARLDELFQLIRADLDKPGLLRRINGGGLIPGGGARRPRPGCAEQGDKLRQGAHRL